MDKFLPQNKNKKENEEYCTIHNRENIEQFLNTHYKKLFPSAQDLKKEYLRQLNEVKDKIVLKRIYFPYFYYHYVPYTYVVDNYTIKTIILEEKRDKKEE